MTESRRAAVIAELVAKLREQGSWAGETHVQKTTYFLQEMLSVPLGLRYTLYKYGPFSFGLRDQLSEMCGLGQLQLERQPYPYGPKLQVAPGASQLQTRFPKTIRRYGDKIDFVARELSPLGVGSLEQLATALLVEQALPNASTNARAAQLHEYKPHVSVEEAREALEHVDRLRTVAV